MVDRRKVIIMGAAGRDFHNFNVLYRSREEVEVVAFTATQIPGIGGRRYPPSLAGRLYPDGIPIFPEEDLPTLLKETGADLVVFSYSDVPHVEVMHRASIANALGADFLLLGTAATSLKSTKPLIAVCAVRTGAGKSQTTRRLVQILQAKGKKVVVIRHPMPYGVLENQAVERFATFEDLEKYECTIEEREEYEPHLDRGVVVFAGVDYEQILREAEKEADVIVWDGGNNDTPFYQPDLHIVVADPLRPGDELTYHPGETNLRMADVVVINKVDSAKPEDVETVRRNAEAVNPEAVLVEAASPISIVDPEPIKGKRVLVIEDGPTLTHGDMAFGAATIAARRFDAKEIVDAEPHAVGSIKRAYKKYPHLKRILPAMGYGEPQIRELEETINAADCDLVLSGTPVDLRRILKVDKPVVRVRYELDEIGHPNLEDVVREFLGI
ncbi:MAG TPA: cyclic 2,3-diphosphoglycerate synthase [Thermoplasmata archaeon]|nr:cyclic 2,3-diphosphoglycerate synthase [Thermoplasmata archaeon]